MTFDDWWETLTTREQARIVREHVAEAWNEAAKAERNAIVSLAAAQMALASGLCDADLSSDDQVCTDYGDATEAVEKFAAMVSAWAIAEEREACAALCERLCLDGLSGHEYADAIRKRSNM